MYFLNIFYLFRYKSGLRGVGSVTNRQDVAYFYGICKLVQLFKTLSDDSHIGLVGLSDEIILVFLLCLPLSGNL